MIRRIRNHILKKVKKKQFDKGSIYGDGTRFDFMSKCQNSTGNIHNIIIGTHCMIRGLLCSFDSGTITIGNNCYVGGGVRIGSVSRIIIGNNVIIGNDTHIYDNNNHPVSPQKRLEMTQSCDFFGSLWQWSNSETKPIIINDNVWIGERCTILKGVNIGKGAIVGCNSVVTHDVPDYTIVAGNPAKIVKYISH